MKHIVYTIIIIICTSCASNNKRTEKDVEDITLQSTEETLFYEAGLVEIDAQKKYPSLPKMTLRDIASIEYIPLETNDSVLLGYVKYAISDSVIVATDKSQNSFFLFDRKGKFLNSFNHQGGGKEEYQKILCSCVDFSNKEIFIYETYSLYRMLVYSFDGKFKRKLEFSEPVWVDLSCLYEYNKDWLISYDNKEKSNRPYFLISKKNGEIRRLPLIVEKKISNHVRIPDEKSNRTVSMMVGDSPNPVLKMPQGAIISDFSKDTIYHATDNSLSPIAVCKNKVQTEAYTDLISLCMTSNRYLCFNHLKRIVNTSTHRLDFDACSSRYLLYDKKEKKMYETEITRPDVINGSGRIWDNSEFSSFPNNSIVFYFLIDWLKMGASQGWLTGELKNIATGLEEDANPVLMIAKLKN